MIEHMLETIEDGIRDVKMYECWAKESEEAGDHKHAEWIEQHAKNRMHSLTQDWEEVKHEVDNMISEMKS